MPWRRSGAPDHVLLGGGGSGRGPPQIEIRPKSMLPQEGGGQGPEGWKQFLRSEFSWMGNSSSKWSRLAGGHGPLLRWEGGGQKWQRWQRRQGLHPRGRGGGKGSWMSVEERFNQFGAGCHICGLAGRPFDHDFRKCDFNYGSTGPHQRGERSSPKPQAPQASSSSPPVAKPPAATANTQA